MRSAHVVLTMFNVGVYSDRVRYWNGHEPGCSDPDDWTAKRLDLLRNVAVPSLARQTNNEFFWVVIIDEETPEKFVRELRKIMSPVNGSFLRTHGCFSDSLGDETEGFVEYLKWLVPDNVDRLLTTRLDTDMAISPNYIEVCDRNIECCDDDTFIIDAVYQTRAILKDGEMYHKQTLAPPIVNASYTVVSKMSSGFTTSLHAIHTKSFHKNSVFKFSELSTFALSHDTNIKCRLWEIPPDLNEHQVFARPFLERAIKVFGIKYPIARTKFDKLDTRQAIDEEG